MRRWWKGRCSRWRLKHNFPFGLGLYQSFLQIPVFKNRLKIIKKREAPHTGPPFIIFKIHKNGLHFWQQHRIHGVDDASGLIDIVGADISYVAVLVLYGDVVHAVHHDGERAATHGFQGGLAFAFPNQYRKCIEVILAAYYVVGQHVPGSPHPRLLSERREISAKIDRQMR